MHHIQMSTITIAWCKKPTLQGTGTATTQFPPGPNTPHASCTSTGSKPARTKLHLHSAAEYLPHPVQLHNIQLHTQPRQPLARWHHSTLHSSSHHCWAYNSKGLHHSSCLPGTLQSAQSTWQTARRSPRHHRTAAHTTAPVSLAAYHTTSQQPRCSRLLLTLASNQHSPLYIAAPPLPPSFLLKRHSVSPIQWPCSPHALQLVLAFFSSTDCRPRALPSP